MNRPRTEAFGILLFLAVLLSAQANDRFLEKPELKDAEIQGYKMSDVTSEEPTVSVIINPPHTSGQISKYLYSSNANLRMTQIIDQPVLLSRINLLSPGMVLIK